jgi:hypothetical protein
MSFSILSGYTSTRYFLYKRNKTQTEIAKIASSNTVVLLLFELKVFHSPDSVRQSRAYPISSLIPPPPPKDILTSEGALNVIYSIHPYGIPPVLPFQYVKVYVQLEAVEAGCSIFSFLYQRYVRYRPPLEVGYISVFYK